MEQKSKSSAGQPRRKTGKIFRNIFYRFRKLDPASLNTIIGITVLLIGASAFAGVLYLAFDRQFSPEARKEKQTSKARIEHTEGDWKARIDGSRVTLQAHDGFFQLLYSKAGSSIRRYSRGTIEAEGNYLIFKPDTGFGKPENTEYSTYYGWSMPTFAIEAARRHYKLIWKKGPVKYSLPRQIADNYSDEDIDELLKSYKVKNPLFSLAKDEFIIWEPIE